MIERKKNSKIGTCSSRVSAQQKVITEEKFEKIRKATETDRLIEKKQKIEKVERPIERKSENENRITEWSESKSKTNTIYLGRFLHK